MDSCKIPAPVPAKATYIENLRAVKVLGKGATGTVFLVHEKSGDQLFALKVVEKSSAHHHSDRRARHEISVLRRLGGGEAHPFLPHLICSSEDDEFICWGIPYCPGGDLNVLRRLQSDRVYSAAVIRFYLAEIVCALEHLHGQGIVYRDLKPENILVQQSGHVTLTDFDLSRDLALASPISKSSFYSDSEQERVTGSCTGTRTRSAAGKKARARAKAKSARVSPVSRRSAIDDFSANERCHSFVGTEEYVAPEVVRGDGHEFAVDWWALGVLAYEMMYGTTPFKGRNRKETFRKILYSQPEFVGKPDSLRDLIGKLLEKDPTRRLGYRRGAAEIKEHEFFRGLRWELLTEVFRPPFLPPRDEVEVAAEGGIDIKEYFQRKKLPPSPLWSPSRNEVSLTEF